MSDEGWIRFQYRLWHDAFDKASLKLPVWLFLTIGPFLLDWFYGQSDAGNRLNVPLTAWIAYWSLALLFQFAHGVGDVVRRLEQEVDTRKPRLSGRVEWHRLGRLADGARVMLTALRLDNDGADSKVFNWRMVTREGTPEQNKPEISGELVDVKTDDGPTIRCQMNQYLPFVLNGTALGKHHRQGFLIFRVQTEPRPEDVIRYTFRDRLDTLYSAARAASSGGDIKSFPPELTVEIMASDVRGASPAS